MWQTASDFIIFLGWAWENISLILSKIFLPIQYIYTFLKSLILNAFSNPIIPDTIWEFNEEILSIFDAIPYWNVLIGVLGLCITILVIVFLVKQFLRT